jgi:hypothetical protein
MSQDEKTRALHVTGAGWLADVSPLGLEHDTWQLEGEDGRMEIESVDVDEIAVHFFLGDDEQATFSFYTNRLGAFGLSGLLQMEAQRER